MALTLEQEKNLLALLDEKRTTLPELTAATEIYGSDLFLTNQMLSDKSVTADVVKQFVSPDATLDKRGIVQLTNDANSADETKAVTPKGVKTALGNYLPLTGGALSGGLRVPYLNIRNDTGWRNINFQNAEGMNVAGLEINNEGNLYLYTKKDAKTITGRVRLKADGYFEIMGNTNILPIGAPIPWPVSKPPVHWLKCNGAAFDKTIYPELAKVYPSGVLPDLRSEFIRGWDDGRGVDIGRGILSWQNECIEAHRHSSIEFSQNGDCVNQQGKGELKLGRHVTTTNPSNGNVNLTGLYGGNETRPRNVAFLYIVRAA